MARRPALTSVVVDAIALVRIPQPRTENAMQVETGDSDAVAAVEREATAEFYIDPSAELPTHRIVKQIQRLYQAGRIDKFGMLGGPRQARQVVRASPTILPRSLHIANLLCHAFAARRWPISLDGSQDRVAQEPTTPLRVTVLDQEARITIEERSRRTFSFSPQRNGDIYQFAPTGQLALQVCVRGGSTAELVDRINNPPVEQHLNEFCRRIIRAAARANARDAEASQKACVLDEAWRQHEDREHIRQFQARLVEEIEGQAAAWTKHQQIAGYVAAVRDTYAGESHLTAPDKPLGRWLAWADTYVAQLDPRRCRKLDPASLPTVIRGPRPWSWGR